MHSECASVQVKEMQFAVPVGLPGNHFWWEVGNLKLTFVKSRVSDLEVIRKTLDELIKQREVVRRQGRKSGMRCNQGV